MNGRTIKAYRSCFCEGPTAGFCHHPLPLVPPGFNAWVHVSPLVKLGACQSTAGGRWAQLCPGPRLPLLHQCFPGSESPRTPMWAIWVSQPQVRPASECTKAGHSIALVISSCGSHKGQACAHHPLYIQMATAHSQLLLSWCSTARQVNVTMGAGHPCERCLPALLIRSGLPKTSTHFSGMNLNAQQETPKLPRLLKQAAESQPQLTSSMPRSSSTAEGLSWDSPVFVKGAPWLPSPVQLPPPLLICTHFRSKGLFACPGHLQFFLCCSPCYLASPPWRGSESSWPLSHSKPCPCSPPLTLSAQCLIQSFCNLSLLITSTSLNIWFFKLPTSNW